MVIVQFFLIISGLTTNEYLRDVYSNIKNPFNKGCLPNIKGFLFKNISEISVSEDYLRRKDLAENLKREKGIQNIKNDINLN